MEKVAQKFNRKGKIGYVFLDALYDAENPGEKKHFDQALEKLHEYLVAAVGLPNSEVKEIETENANLKRMIAEKERMEEMWEALGKFAEAAGDVAMAGAAIYALGGLPS